MKKNPDDRIFTVAYTDEDFTTIQFIQKSTGKPIPMPDLLLHLGNGALKIYYDKGNDVFFLRSETYTITLPTTRPNLSQ